MEIRLNGEVAALHAPGGRLDQIVGALRHWAEKAGRTICALSLDGEEVTPEYLEGKVGEALPPNAVLDVRTVDRNHVGSYALQRASRLLPGLRMELSLAARALRNGETRSGLGVLHRAVTALGSVEAALNTLSARRGGPDGDPLHGEPATSGLKELIRKIHVSMRAGDLGGVAEAIGEDGARVVDDCRALLQRVLRQE